MERTLKEGGETIKINYPIVADLSGEISKKYGMLHTSENETEMSEDIHY